MNSTNNPRKSPTVTSRFCESLPAPPQALGAYVTAVQQGNLLFLSGVLPIRDGKAAFVGHLGNELSIADGREAAALATLNALAIAQAALGSLDRVARVIRITVYLATSPAFIDHARVADAASDVLNLAFGQGGGHARLAMGVASLPGGMPVELELVFSLNRE